MSKDSRPAGVVLLQHIPKVVFDSHGRGTNVEIEIDGALIVFQMLVFSF